MILQDPTDYPNPDRRPFVALVHFGDPAITARCVASLARHETTLHTVVVSDHGPAGPEDLEQALRGLHPDVRILRRDNPGFGAGCNAAAEASFAAGAEAVWFLNNDAEVEAPILGPLLNLAFAHPEVGLWGTWQREGARRHGPDRLPAWWPDPPFRRVADPESGPRFLEPRETLSGASILITRAAWARLGPWPEWCFLYWEDVAWCLRAHALGLPLVMTDLEVTHARNTTTGRRSPMTAYYGTRNELLLHARLWPEAGRARWLHALHVVQKRLFQGRWGMVPSVLRGVRDAFRGVEGRA